MSRSVTRIHKELVKKDVPPKDTMHRKYLQKNTKDPKLKKKSLVLVGLKKMQVTRQLSQGTSD